MIKKAALVSTVHLRPHQDEAIQKYLRNDNRQIFAHGLGSGKTITSIGAVEKSNSKSALILTPASLQKNYQDSIEKFVTPESRSKYHVMSYEKFRMDPDRFIDEYQPDTLVVDEYHRQKDPTGVSFRAIKSIRPRIKNFIGLTGTVMQNTPQEIFPLVNLARGDDKGKLLNKDQFNKEFTKTEKVYPKGIISNLMARLMGRYGERKVLKNQKELHSLISPYVDKNVPNEDFLKEFPKKEIVDIDTPMTPKQQKIYDYFMNKDLGFIDRWRVKHDLPPSAKNSDKIFSKLIHARQASNTPTVLSENMKDDDPIAASGKFTKAYENLQKHLKENPKNKVMVYSNFMDSGVSPFAQALTKANIPYGEFSGRVTRKSRNNDITDFNAGKKRVLLSSPSGAEGLDLKGVTLLQNLDPHWNGAKMEQIFGRAARYKSHAALPPNMRKVRIERYRSTTKPGFFKRLLGKKHEKSIDQYIYDRAAEKTDLVDQVNDLI